VKGSYRIGSLPSDYSIIANRSYEAPGKTFIPGLGCLVYRRTRLDPDKEYPGLPNLTAVLYGFIAFSEETVHEGS
jgi:hypothetical protein